MPAVQRLDRGNAEAFVFGRQDHDVGASEQVCQLGVDHPPVKRHGVAQAELVGVTAQGARVRRHDGAADDVERGARVVVAAGHEEPGDGVLKGLVGSDPAHAHPPRAAGGVGRRGALVGHPVGVERRVDQGLEGRRGRYDRRARVAGAA